MKNLLSKLSEKLKKLNKPLVSGLLAMTMLTAPLTACDTDDLSNSTYPPYNNSQNDSSLGGSSSDSNDANNSDDSSSSDSSGGSDSSSTNRPSDSTQNDYFNSYSKILQTVIKGSYYSDLIRYEDSKYFKIEGDEANNNIYFYTTTKDNYCENIPYGFLEEVGYDINALKKADNSKVVSEVYILDEAPNDLYIQCGVLNQDSIDYYDTYLLKYTLTNTELRDLNRLFDMQACGFAKGSKKAIYQAPFFIQELSYQKEPEVLVHSGMEAETFNWFRNNLSLSDLTKNSYACYDIDQKIKGTGLIPLYSGNSEVVLQNQYTERQYHYLSFASRSLTYDNINLLKGTCDIYNNIKCRTGDSIKNPSVVQKYNNINVLNINSPNATLLFYDIDTPQPVENCSATPKQATFYTVHNASLINGLTDISNYAAYIDDASWLYKEITTGEGTGNTNNIEK